MKQVKLFAASRRTIVMLLGGIIVGTAGFGWLGWKWRHTVPLNTIVITGNTHVASTNLNKRVAITGDTLLYSVRTADVVERLLEDPWVATATVRRRPTGTLVVRVVERVPVAVLLRNGRPSLYLDRYGSAMQVTAGNPVDVPVLHEDRTLAGLKAGERTTEPRLLEMLETIAGLDEKIYDMISEVRVTPVGMTVFTTPLPDAPSVKVQFGDEKYEEKMQRLSAFWDQVMLESSREAVIEIKEIDLRYNGQIITS